MSVKLIFKEEVRRFLPVQPFTFADLRKKVQELFGLVNDFRITYRDDEDETICISSEDEFMEALRLMSSELQMKTMRFVIQKKTLPESVTEATPTASIPEAEAQVIHAGVTCDDCGMNPISGPRFKCSVRHDFDLCGTCERHDTSGFPMIKINQPQAQHFGMGGGGFWRRGLFRPPGPHHHGGRGGCGGGRAGGRGFGPGGRGMGGGRCGFGGRGGGPHRNESPIIDGSAIRVVFDDEDSEWKIKADKKWGEKIDELQVKLKSAAETEEALVQEALYESLSDEEDKVMSSVVEDSIVSNNNEVCHIPSAGLAVPFLPKPALRFVRDVTYPDGIV